MRSLILLAALFCVGCAGRGPAPIDYFDGQSEFAAERQRETMTLPSVRYADAYVHTVEVLMDLDCTLQASNRALGVISATGMIRVLPADNLLAVPSRWRSCGGHRVTVTLRDAGSNGVLVRASFDPPSQDADQAFRTLLRRSLSLDTEREVQHAN
jgi:hypothetical protein